MEALINLQPSGKNFHIWFYEGNVKKYKFETNFKPYFYGCFDDKRVFTKQEEIEKVFVQHPADVRKERTKYPFTYEADVLYHNRYLIDTYYKEPIPPCNFRLAFFDIENLYDETTKAVPNVMKADYAITAISVLDCWTKKVYSFAWHPTITKIDKTNKVFIFPTEKQMFKAFLEFWKTKSFDVISGWNSADYDLPYLVNRLTKFGLEKELSPIKEINFDKRENIYKIAGISHLDYMEHCKRRATQDKESWSLDFVAKEVLGKGKIPLAQSTNKTWENDIEKLIEYNRNDVELLYELEYGSEAKKNEKGFRFIELADELRRIGRIIFDDTLKNSKIFDNLIICKLKEEGLVARTKPQISDDEEKDFIGAFVKEPKKGIYDWIIDLDVTSLYPSIILSLNISPEITSIFQEKGIIPKVLEKIQELRKKYKDEYKETRSQTAYLRQWAYKILANSLYGYLGYRGSRLFDIKLAEKVTLTGQKIIKFASKKIEEKGYRVIYNDTDSIFVQINPLDLPEAKRICKEIQDYVNNSMKEIEQQLGMKNNMLHFKQETIARRAVFLAKKRYVMWVINDEGKDVDNMKYIGIDSVRSDTPKIAKRFLKRVYEMALKGKEKSEIERYIETFRNSLFKLPPEEIALPIAIKKNPEDYGSKPIHVAGAILWNKHFFPKISEGMKIKYIYLKGCEKQFEGVGHVLSIPNGEKIPDFFVVDYEHMARRLVDMKVMDLMELIGKKEQTWW